MSKRHSFLLLLVTFSLLSFGQNNNHTVDRLSQIIQNKNNTDLSESYNKLYKNNKRKDIKLAKVYLDSAYYNAIRFNNKKQLGISCNYLGYYYFRRNNADTAEMFFHQCYKIRKEIKDTLGVARVLNNLGTFYLEKSDFSESAKCAEEALNINLSLSNSVDAAIKGAGISYNILANVYDNLEKNDSAIIYFQNALEQFSKINFKRGIASCYNNIGLIYQDLSKEIDTTLMNKALEFYERALVQNKELGNEWGQAEQHNNISNILSQKAERYRFFKDSLSTNPEEKEQLNKIINDCINKAIANVDSSIQYQTKINDVKGLIASNIGLGAIYNNSRAFKKAIKHFNIALELSQEINDEYSLLISHTYLGMALIEMKQYKTAIKHLSKAEFLSEKTGLDREKSSIYRSFSDVYERLKEYKTAFNYYKKYKAIQDKNYSEKYLKSINDMQTKYETELKEKALKLSKAKAERQKNIIYSFIVLFLIVIFFLVIVVKQIKQIKKKNATLSSQKETIEKANNELNSQNKEIIKQKDEIQKQHLIVTEQKNHIEEIHKEVSDSIQYAERIQKAVLPKIPAPENVIHQFTLFKPKDIVSGDYHWTKFIKERNLFISAAADCTGHGVPGAFMSMLGVSFLNEIINRPDINSAGKVLDALRDSVIHSLNQTGKSGEAKDGMDIALIVYNPETRILQFSGANNPLYLIRSAQKEGIEYDKIVEEETHTLYELKGDKMPIGIYDNLSPFTTHSIQIEPDDRIYLFSDGYADQFGGPKGKKFKYLPMKRMILKNCEKPMDVQKDIYNKAFNEWKGDTDQIDDVLLMGYHFL